MLSRECGLKKYLTNLDISPKTNAVSLLSKSVFVVTRVYRISALKQIAAILGILYVRAFTIEKLCVQLSDLSASSNFEVIYF